MTSWYNHAKISAFFCTIYIFSWIFIHGIETIFKDPFLFLSLAASPGIPDLDRKARKRKGTLGTTRDPYKHRHWFWHSAIVPCLTILPLFLSGTFLSAGIVCLCVGLHLLADVKIKGKKIGTYLIFKRKGDRMGRKNTDRYLIFNGIVSVLFSVAILAL